MRLFALLLLVVAAPLAQAASLRANLIPEQPLIERTRDEQRLNFDLMFQNDGDTALELAGLEVTLFDRQGRFFSQRRLDRNGDSSTMSILTVPNRTLPPKGRLVVFNPFHGFPTDYWLGDLRFEATFTGGKDQPEQRVQLRVAPRAFNARTRLALPLHGETFVHDVIAD